MFTKKSKPSTNPVIAFERALDAALCDVSRAHVSRHEVVAILERAIAAERQCIAANVSLSPGFVSANVPPSIGDRISDLTALIRGDA